MIKFWNCPFYLIPIILVSLCINVSAQTAKRFDIVINEILADPAPVVGLPNSEYVELKNVSSFSVNLRNWKLSDGTSTATVSSNYILQPDSLVIICATTAVTSFAAFGNAIGVTGFPSLNNDADIIWLISPEQNIIHAVNFSMEWYNNSVKSDGGWSLEMIDAENPCSGSFNWKASEDPKGGTPGKKNSVESNNPDHTSPVLLRTYSLDSLSIVAIFDEPLDSLSASVPPKYFVDNNVGIAVQAIPIAPLFREVKLKFNRPFSRDTVYQLKVSGVLDCSGNVIGAFNTAKTGSASICDSLDLVINEILFNPSSDGTDYIETYNRSNKIFDASELFIASRNTSGAIVSAKKISETPFLIFPRDFITVTEQPSLVHRKFFVKNSEMLLAVSTLPSLPDSEGEAILLNEHGKIIDDLKYHEDWHFAFTDDKSGVALERIGPDKRTNDPENWTSAASTAGFGTPTSNNSQFKNANAGNTRVFIPTKIFSPDNDGVDDLCFIYFQMDRTGYSANVSVFDINGKIVKKLISNRTLSQNAFIRWDGMNDLGGKCQNGLYIILTEIFDLNGNRKKFKNAVALARKF